jgi:hypothetical protein
LFVKVYFVDWLEIDVYVVANRTVGCDGGESKWSTRTTVEPIRVMEVVCATLIDINIMPPSF